MVDIPNFVTLAIELGVAFLILWIDRRQRRREAENIIRFQEQQKQATQAEIRQRERFTNWQKENSKRQIMLLESIISTLDVDKVDNFKAEVGSRYAKEINQDMEDLEQLLEMKKDMDDSDPELEADIESKIDEIETAKDFVKNFLPQETINQIGDIASSAKIAYQALKDLPERLNQSFPGEKGHTIQVDLDGKKFDIDPQDPEDIDSLKNEVLKDYKQEKQDLFNSLNLTLKETLEEMTSELEKNLPDDTKVPSKIMDAVKSSLMGTMNVGKMVDKIKKSAQNTEEDEVSKADKENEE